MKTKEQIQIMIDDTLTSMRLSQGSPNIISRLKKELATYKELMNYIELEPTEEFIMKQIELLKINVSKCEHKIAEETKLYTNGMIPKTRIDEIRDEFGYKSSSHKLRYLNYLMS